MSKPYGTKASETPHADPGPDDLIPYFKTLRFDRGSFGNSGRFCRGEILYLKDAGFFRIAFIDESWDEPCHEHFEIEHRLVNCLPVIPEDRLECRGRACRLAPIYDHAVSEPPRLPWRKADGSLLASEPTPVLTRDDHASQTIEAIITYAAVSASAVFSFAAATLLTRFVC